MKIVVGADKLLYGYGISRIAVDMATYLHKSGINVKLTSGKCDISTEVPVILCKYNDRLFQSSIPDILGIIKREKPDIFCSHFYPMDICGAILNHTSTKHILYYHGVSYFTLCPSVKARLVYLRSYLGEFFGAHSSTKIIAVSKFLKNELKTKYKVKDGKVTVVYNGIDLRRFNPTIDGTQIRERHGIGSNEVVLLCVAALAPQKGQHLLIDCMKILASEMSNVRLLLVGRTGTENPRHGEILQKKVNDAGLSSRITFCGHVDDAVLPQYYGACDVSASATKWEGFGLPFVEAMACSKPVIGFDRTSISELIVDGYNGYKVKYLDMNEMATRIACLAADVNLRRKLGANGRKFAEENFDLEKNMGKVVKLCYSSLE